MEAPLFSVSLLCQAFSCTMLLMSVVVTCICQAELSAAGGVCQLRPCRVPLAAMFEAPQETFGCYI